MCSKLDFTVYSMFGYKPVQYLCLLLIQFFNVSMLCLFCYICAILAEFDISWLDSKMAPRELKFFTVSY